MRIVSKKLHARHVAPALLKMSPSLTLSYQQRSKSRLRAMLSTGEEVAISLPRGTVMRGGDVLVGEDGHLITVHADNEQVLRVTTEHSLGLLRAAYHLGNRHVPVEVGSDYLHLEFDSVLYDMLNQLGVRVEKVTLPFEPENGAYGGGHKHGHDATFAEDYALAQSAFHAHEHSHKHSHDHSHDHSSCNAHGHGNHIKK